MLDLSARTRPRSVPVRDNTKIVLTTALSPPGSPSSGAGLSVRRHYQHGEPFAHPETIPGNGTWTQYETDIHPGTKHS